MKRFSLILNSRQRPELLLRLFNNIVDKTVNFNDIEIIVGCDNDDLDSLHLISDIFSVEHPISSILRFLFIERDKNLNFRLNHLASLTTGEYVWSINDDIEINTDNWDVITYEQLNVFPHGIVYGQTHCDSVDHDPHTPYSSFPIVSKRAINIVGKLHPTECFNLGGEVETWRLYDSLNCIVSTDLSVKHLLHQTLEQVYHPDKTAWEMRRSSNISQIDYLNNDLSEYANKLKEYIDNVSE